MSCTVYTRPARRIESQWHNLFPSRVHALTREDVRFLVRNRRNRRNRRNLNYSERLSTPTLSHTRAYTPTYTFGSEYKCAHAAVPYITVGDAVARLPGPNSLVNFLPLFPSFVENISLSSSTGGTKKNPPLCKSYFVVKRAFRWLPRRSQRDRADVDVVTTNRKGGTIGVGVESRFTKTPNERFKGQAPRAALRK